MHIFCTHIEHTLHTSYAHLTSQVPQLYCIVLYYQSRGWGPWLTSYAHLANILHTSCTHLAHILRTPCTHLAHTLHTSCTHLAHIFCTPCTHLVRTLHTSCTFLAHILRTFTLKFILTFTLTFTLTFINWRSVQSFYWRLFFVEN